MKKETCKCGKTIGESMIKKEFIQCKIHAYNECCDCGYKFKKESKK